MNAKVLLAALAGGVAAFLLGWLVFGILLDPWYRSIMTPEALAAMRTPEEMQMWGIVLSNLVYGLLLALIFNRWANISTFRSGAIAGAVICFLVALSFDLSFVAFMKMWTNNLVLLVDPIANAVLGAIIGGVIGWVLGYGRQAA
jgi:hypothetical protein